MKYCSQLAESIPDLAQCCTSCHEDGDAEMEVEYGGEKYQVCCTVKRDIERREQKSNVCTCGRQATGDHEPGCNYRPDFL